MSHCRDFYEVLGAREYWYYFLAFSMLLPYYVIGHVFLNVLQIGYFIIIFFPFFS